MPKKPFQDASSPQHSFKERFFLICLCVQPEAAVKLTIGRRALTSNPLEGWFPDILTNKRRACSIPRPATFINPNRIAFIRLFTHDKHKPFHQHIEIVRQYLSPKSPDGNCPPAKSSFIAACASSLFPHL
jgi:hypothetical protein